MLFLLRQIRRKTLLNNKFTTYFLYAIGEIMLVVIGILIAVSIDSWNEAKKDRIQEYKSLEELRSALQADLSDIQFNIGWHKSAQVSCEMILEAIDLKIPHTDSINTHFGRVLRFSQFVPEIGTYESLKGNNLSLISDDSLRIKITHYYENNIQFALGTEQLNRALFPQNMELYQKHFFNTQITQYAIPRNYENLITNEDYQSFLYATKSLRQSEATLFKDLEVTCKELIQLIDLHLQNK